jgi:hypothetical protein
VSVITTAKEAIEALTGLAVEQGADANDTTGVVRQIVTAHLPGRPDAQFAAWFCVCIEIGDRAARAEGYDSAVARAWALATRRAA